MKKKVYEASSISIENFSDLNVFMISTEIPSDWFKDYDDDWENTF